MSSTIAEKPTMATNDMGLQDLVVHSINDVVAAASDAANIEEPTTPKAKAKGPVKKKTSTKKQAAKAESADDNEAETTATPATGATAKTTGTVKKRGAEAVDGETPTKKPKTAKPKTPKEPKAPKEPKTPKEPKEPKPAKTLKAKSAATAFPESAADFSDADRLIVKMKKDGSPWPAINEAWEELTRKAPGKDVLRKRFAKLMAVAQQFKAGDALKLAEAKKIVDEEIVAAVRRLELEKWSKIATHMAEKGADTYTAQAVEKKWAVMVKNKEVDATGNYIGDDAAEEEDAADNAAYDADEVVAENSDNNAGGEEANGDDEDAAGGDEEA